MIFTGIIAQVVRLAETGRLPDAIVRRGIRRLLRERLRLIRELDCETLQEQKRRFIAECGTQPVALVPEAANEQHYEVRAEFFRKVLGPRLKYSCCYWGSGVSDLQSAEEAALRITCERAGLADGQRILELGCGWGSLSLWMAEKYPSARITAVSNSHGQRQFIEACARERGFRNLRVITADMNHFSIGETFDRVVSVEMFEHMRNHRELLRRIHGWLVPGGRLFVHIFSHRETPYLFEDNGPADWMTRYFFAGGMMPSDDLLIHYQRDLSLVDHWRWSGGHYRRTCEAWLERCDERRNEVLDEMRQAYGDSEAPLWLQRWRIFFMACSELFAAGQGNEWGVSHYLFEKTDGPRC